MRQRLDLVLAAVVVAVGVAERLARPPGEFAGPPAADIAALALIGALLAGRLGAPRACTWGFLVVAGIQAGLLSPPTAYRIELLPTLLLAYTAGTRLRGRELPAWALVYVAVVTVATVRLDEGVGSDFVFYPAIGLGAFAAGRAAYNRSLLVARLERQTRELEDHAAAASRRAVAEERRRIAHELHDVVAHAISVMVVQAGGGRRTLASDATRAAEAAAQVEHTGREALLEMRRLLAVLRDPDAPAEREPNPTLDGLPRLIERLAADGLPVTLAVTGEPRPVPAGLGLGAYRVVQDALEDAVRAAPGAPTAVRVHWGEDVLQLRVTDRRPGGADAAPGDPGLLGARERVAVYGGSLDVHTVTGGGHEVVAELPYGLTTEPTTTQGTTGGAT